MRVELQPSLKMNRSVADAGSAVAGAVGGGVVVVAAVM